MQLSKPCLDGIIIPRDILFVNCINFVLPLQIQENITCAQPKQKRAYSKTMAKGVQVFNFKEGDHVLRRNMVKANTKGNNCKKYFSMRWKPVVHTPDIKYNYLVNYNFFLSQCLLGELMGADTVQRSLSQSAVTRSAKSERQECEDETFYNIDGN